MEKRTPNWSKIEINTNTRIEKSPGHGGPEPAPGCGRLLGLAGAGGARRARALAGWASAPKQPMPENSRQEHRLVLDYGDRESKDVTLSPDLYADSLASVFCPANGLSTASLPATADPVCPRPGPRERPLSRLPPPPPKELEEAYQDAAGDVLVAICRHSWRPVVQQLETEVLTGVFPHRSRLYVMGVLTTNRTSRPALVLP